MWLEIKVNTGREQRHFRFVPCEAESAKTQAEGDVFALFNETPRGSFPKGRDAFQSRKQMPRPPGKFGLGVDEGPLTCLHLQVCVIGQALLSLFSAVGERGR